jgi:hypothetical protein
MMIEALELNLFCIKNDGKAYDQNLQKFQRMLKEVRSVKKEWPPLLKWAELADLAVSIDFFKCEVFPTERADAMTKIVAKYAEVHFDEKRASDILNNGGQLLLDHMEALVTPRASGVLVVAASASEASQMKQVVNTSLHDWWAQAKEKEMEGTDCELQALCIQKEIIAKVGAHLLSQIRYPKSHNCQNLDLYFKYTETENLDKKSEPRPLLVRAGEGHCRLCLLSLHCRSRKNHGEIQGKHAVGRVRHALPYGTMPSRLDMEILHRFCIVWGSPPMIWP